MPSRTMVNLQNTLSDHMDAILRLFKPGAKLTVVVRSPGYGDADVVIGNDDLDECIAAINRMKERIPTFKAGEAIVVDDE